MFDVTAEINGYSTDMRDYRSVSAGTFIVANVLAAVWPAAAQVYPTKQIELVVQFVG